MIQTGLLFLILVFIAWNLLFCDGLRRPKQTMANKISEIGI